MSSSGPVRRVASSVCTLAAVVALPLLTSGSAQVVPTTTQVGAPDQLDELAEPMPSRAELAAATPGPVPLLSDRLRRESEVAVSSPKGTRVWTVSGLSDHGLPLAAKRAYVRAAAWIDRNEPGCQLPWTLLAAVGRVESDHGRYAGARLGEDGLSRPRIIGVALNGAGPVAAIRDTDDGRLDRDQVWDRAVGPMQFIPSTWAFAARDGDADGLMSPHDLDDAATAAASYLCSGGGDLRDPDTQAAAIYRYNHDDYYVALVQAFEAGYRTGQFAVPAPPTEPEQVGSRRKQQTDLPQAHRARATKKRAPHTPQSAERAPKVHVPTTVSPKRPTPAASPKPTAKPTPSASAPAEKPGPSQLPDPPTPTEVQAVLTVCDTGYCLGAQLLELGVVGQPAETAVGDFDLDGVVETNDAELAGMVGTKTTMVVIPVAAGTLGIYSINGVPLA